MIFGVHYSHKTGQAAPLFVFSGQAASAVPSAG